VKKHHSVVVLAGSRLIIC